MRIPRTAATTLAAVAAAAVLAPASFADDCPNAGIRALQGSGHLPDCRAFELVTPVEKAGASPDPADPMPTAQQPGAIAFRTSDTFPGGLTSVAVGAYRSRRSESGWTTRPLDVPQANGSEQDPRPTSWMSSDLGTTVVASRRALAPGAVSGAGNLYLYDVDGEELELVASSSSTTLNLFWYFSAAESAPVLAASRNPDRVVFQAVDDELAARFGAAPEALNIYDWSAGQLRLVNRLPDGSPAVGVIGVAESTYKANSASADGSRVYFTLSGLPGEVARIYMRENGSSTKLISYSQRTGDDPTVPVPGVRFLTTSADGRYAYFLYDGGAPLTDDPHVPGSNGTVYRYDTDDDGLERVVVGTANFTQGADYTIETSADGERLYFLSSADLTPGSTPGEAALYLWENGVTTRIAADVRIADLVGFQAAQDGDRVAFATLGKVLGEDNTSPACPDLFSDGAPDDRCVEVYTTAPGGGRPVCLSCPLQGPSAGHAGVARGNLLLADGTVVFDTPNALVAGDVNGKRDVYEWRDGQTRLLTSGTSSRDAFSRGVSADGTDVYVLTMGRLVAQDRDDLRDVYSVRRLGGLAIQNETVAPPRECVADGCQGPASGPPGHSPVGSIRLGGAGNGSRSAPLRIRASRLKVAVGSVATLRVTVSGAGTVRVTGGAVRGARKSAPRAGSYRLRVELGRKAKTRLAKRGSLAAKVRLSYRSAAGGLVTKTITLRFERPRKGGR